MVKRIIIMGSTGSIGCQALDIIRDNPDKFKAVALTCNSRVDDIVGQIREFAPEAVCVGREEDARRLQQLFPEVTIYFGSEGLVELAKLDADMVLNSLMGISGLEPTYAAIKTGKDIALANKETLVTGGALITELCKEKGVKLLPVDSEHSAIFQCLQGNMNQKIKRILLTCSGGPFRHASLEDLESVTVEQALNHPKWNMGSKITIDSATMMNKGLEVIEAKWLFDVEPEQIHVHIHPQSIVHSMVEFEDTSVIAQLGLPDMRIPISYAFNYPDRLPYKGDSLDFFTTGADLHFEKPRTEVFRSIDLAYEALREGGSVPVVLNGANEELVALFLAGKIKFLDIQRTVEKVMDVHTPSVPKTVEEIIAIDAYSRAKAREIVGR
ncbi:MAG: 1-deoxy-D-xylulose-5-phosphate reductoisomerase [Firmicutes bacterium]|nr:1-deoxy-D-xylulose-5-phosphate reductoisomerase [Bacillota bacterium]